MFIWPKSNRINSFQWKSFCIRNTKTHTFFDFPICLWLPICTSIRLIRIRVRQAAVPHLHTDMNGGIRFEWMSAKFQHFSRATPHLTGHRDTHKSWMGSQGSMAWHHMSYHSANISYHFEFQLNNEWTYYSRVGKSERNTFRTEALSGCTCRVMSNTVAWHYHSVATRN